ncbi:hypothetical protein EAG14_16105 [Acidovorax sp. 1608163]|nr:hypothetical protein EAG14_16105 [Acidovorax sp. 1608163]
MRFKQPASTTDVPLPDGRQQLAAFVLGRRVIVDASGGRVHVTHARFVEYVDAGDNTIGQITGIDCAATASDGHNALAKLMLPEGETHCAMLNRLDKAIRRY